MPSSARLHRSGFERAYSVIVVVKGVDGLLELIAGATLLIAPHLAGQLLLAVAAELAEGSSPLRDAGARSIASAGDGIATGDATLALFLVVHGVVKLVTVTALIRRAIRWYPSALLALAVLLVLQVVDLVTAPSTGGVVLAVSDLVVIALVVWEYRRLRRGQEVAAPHRSAGARTG